MTARGGPMQILVTCEHAGNEVPAELASLFRPHRRLLATHRGYDPGARGVAERLAVTLPAPLLLGRYSRLVVELNRSRSSRHLFSSITRSLPRAERDRIVRACYEPYRTAVERLVVALARRGPVLHLSVHSFTPSLDGKVRDVDLALLYDPARRPEAALSRRWRSGLAALRPELRVGLNRPYKGTSDGLTTHLRRLHPEAQYAGVEIEISQHLLGTLGAQRRAADWFATTVGAAMAGDEIERGGRRPSRRRG